MPLLLAVFAIGLALSGVFPMDPMRGYPPEAPEGDPERLSRTHQVHDHLGSVVFLAMPVLCFAGAVLFLGRPGGLVRGLVGLVIGAALLVLLGRFGREWEAVGDSVGLVQRSMVALGLGWVVVVFLGWLL